MKYPSIKEVKLSREGKKVVRQIKDKLKAGRQLKIALGGSPFLLLFTSSNMIEATFTVTSTDWSMLGKAISSVNTIILNRILTIIELHLITSAMSPKERKFWETMERCFIDQS